MKIQHTPTPTYIIHKSWAQVCKIYMAAIHRGYAESVCVRGVGELCIHPIALSICDDLYGRKVPCIRITINFNSKEHNIVCQSGKVAAICCKRVPPEDRSTISLTTN